MPVFALADCNNFYVSCERAFDPSLRGRPVVVLSNNDGCVISRSEEAKVIGITMGLPVFKARDLVRKYHVAVLSSNYVLYGEMSRRVMDTMNTFPVEREVYSIDEAFLKFDDLPTGDLIGICKEMRQRILQWTGIPVSIGLGPTKTLAKAANRLVKNGIGDDGVADLLNDESRARILYEFPVGDVWGVGRNICKRLEQAGVKTAADLIDTDTFWMKKQFGIKGLALILELRGQVCSDIQSQTKNRKEIVVSRTFGRRLEGYDLLSPAFKDFALRAAERLNAENLAAKTVTTFITMDRYRPDYQGGSSVKLELDVPTSSGADVVRLALAALSKIVIPRREYRKGGIVLGELTAANVIQSTLFSEELDADSIGSAASLGELEEMPFRTSQQHDHTIALDDIADKAPLWEQKRAFLSPRYTTRWDELPKAR